jgi:hypothetical protein
VPVVALLASRRALPALVLLAAALVVTQLADVGQPSARS